MTGASSGSFNTEQNVTVATEARAAKPRTAAKKTAAPKQPDLGSDGALLFDIREKKRLLEEQIKALEAQAEEVQQRVMERMQAEKLDKLTVSGCGTLSISKSVVADVQDWDEFYAFIGKKKYWHLLQKRVSDPAYRELLEANTKVPGVQPFTKTRLNLRATS